MKFAKVLSFFLALLVFAGSFSVYAVSEDYNVDIVGDAAENLAKFLDVEEFDAEVRRAALAYEKSVDIKKYNIGYENGGLGAILQYMNAYMPELFHVETVVVNGWETLTSIQFSYIYTKEEYESKKKVFDKAVAEMTKGLEGLGEAEKALLLHDRLALKCEYDYSVSKRTAYDAIVDGKCVCDGYSKAYLVLLHAVGMKGEFLQSYDLNHSWNIAVVDGVPYYVDVTWDDPSWANGSRGIAGQVSHKNFLRSLKGFRETGHYTSDFNTVPSDTRYDTAFWQNTTAAFVEVKGEIYYIDGDTGKLTRYRDKKALVEIKGMWMKDANTYWAGHYGKLATDGNNLYYSDPKKVYKYDISTGKKTVLKTINAGTYTSIYGMEYRDGYLYCDLNTIPVGNTMNLSRISIELPKEEPSEIVLKDSSYLVRENGYLLGVKEKTTVSQLLSEFENNSAVVRNADGKALDSSAFCGTGCTVTSKGGDVVTLVLLGDVDGSGIVDSTDYMRLKNAFIGSITLEGVNRMAADVLPDGRLDATDYMRIKTYFLGMFDIYA